MNRPKRNIFSTTRSARRTWRAAVFFVLVALTAACSLPTEIPGEFKVVPDGEWKYGHTFVFNEKGDTVAGEFEALEFSVRHTDDYPYANLWVELNYNVGDTTASDTFNIKLANEYGKWFGNGSGPVMQHTDTIRPRLTPNPGSPLRLRHIMRVDVLTDIEQIGLTYVKKQAPDGQ